MSKISFNKAIKKGQGRKADMTKEKRSVWWYRHHFLSRPPPRGQGRRGLEVRSRCQKANRLGLVS